MNPFETKPPTCKKLRIFEVRPLVPQLSTSNSTGERLDESGNSKKLGCYVGKYNLKFISLNKYIKVCACMCAFVHFCNKFKYIILHFFL